MKLSKIIFFLSTSILSFVLVTSCQKMDRPELGEILLDPEPPPYQPLKSFWAFENNTEDQGENDLTTTSVNVSYVPGVTGQAIKFGDKGYVLARAVGDTVRYPNEFVGLPIDTLTSLGSFTFSFWMNVPGPVQGGAQGVFSMSNKNQFWGNFDIFLENWSNAADPSEVFMKVHMFNAGVASGNGEQWNEVKIPGVLGKWSHIAITYNHTNSQFTIYANGQSVHNRVLGGGTYGRVRFNDFNGMVLGTHQFQTNPTLTNHGPQDWAKSINGSLDQFRIHNQALTAAEVTQLYTSKQ